MKQEQYNQTKALQKHLTQNKWWNNPKLKDLWVTTHLGTKALVISVLQHDYILLDRHYNQLKVHSMRVKESREVVVKKHDTLCKFITEISPKVKKKKKKKSPALSDMTRIFRGGTQLTREIQVDVPTRIPQSEPMYYQVPDYEVRPEAMWIDYHVNQIRIVGDEDDTDE